MRLSKGVLGSVGSGVPNGRRVDSSSAPVGATSTTLSAGRLRSASPARA